ncbi:hypothetical protein SALBM311S_10795 [Streptomyces alboniger]
MRPAKATAAAVTAVLAAGAASVVVGRRAGDAALKAPPGLPLPTEPRLTVHATAAGRITVTRDLAALRPGTYGLVGDGSHAVVGPVLGAETRSADTVVRRLERVTYGTVQPGDKVWFTPNLYVGDPATALGLDHTDVDVPGELGTLPAWFVPGIRETWVITVHGLGTTREHPMNIMEFLQRHRFPVLALAYRGDPGAPRRPDGLNHFGETEWHDLDAAIGYAVANGARRVVLYGWSTEHDGIDPEDAHEVLTRDEATWLWVDTAAAVADHGEAPMLVRHLESALQPTVPALLDEVRAVGHPRTVQVLVALAAAHPDPALAKAVRRAAFQVHTGGS